MSMGGTSVNASGYGRADYNAFGAVGRAQKQAASVAGNNMLPSPANAAPVSQAPATSVANAAVILLVILVLIRVAEHFAGAD